MTKALFLGEQQLAQLRKNIGPNMPQYAAAASWAASYFGGESWCFQSSIDIPDNIALMMPRSKTDTLDLENTRVVYGALKHLTPLQASEERLWAYLTHVTFWEYTRKRWPLENYDGRRPEEYIQERYLFASDRSRALVRNGIARLWWYGHATYDSTREDPFELTAVLLKTLDVTQNVIERAFSRNRVVTNAILSVLLEREQSGSPFYERLAFRDLTKYLVQVGGVTVVDALSPTDLKSLISNRIDEMASRAA